MHQRPATGPRGPRLVALAVAAIVAALLPSAAGARVVPWIDLETGGVWSGYNDVRIPGDGGTKFSLHDDLSTDAAPYTRVRAGVTAGRHEVSALYAPLRLSADGIAPADLAFFGDTGARIEYALSFFGVPLRWRTRRRAGRVRR